MTDSIDTEQRLKADDNGGFADHFHRFGASGKLNEQILSEARMS